MIRNVAAGVTSFTSNAFLVEGDRSVLVDTGANFDVVAAVRERVDTLDAVLITHTHPDHVGKVAAVRRAFDVVTWGFDPNQPAVDRPIEDRQTVRIGDDEYTAIHTPGHKNDHLCFYAPSSGVLFAGDLLFADGGFGRTDLEEGDRSTLLRSIETILEVTEDSLSVMHCGHGPSVDDDPRSNIELAYHMAQTG